MAPQGAEEPPVDASPEADTIFQLGRFDQHGTARALHDGHWIEVEHGIPGETVRAEIVGQKRQRGRILEILEAAPDRVFPPCPYFREWSCGGCQWQQISAVGQLARKREEVEHALQRTGMDLAIDATHALDDPWKYRTTAGIALGKRAGFRRQASLAIVPIRECPISHPLLGELMAALNDQLEVGALPDFRGRVRLDVRLLADASGEGLQVLIRPDEHQRIPTEQVSELARVLQGLAPVQSVLLAGEEGRIEILSGALFGHTTVAGRQVTLSAASFFQTNLRLLPTLIERIRQEAGPLGGKRVADVYGGVGIFGLFLAAEAREVMVIETDPIAIEAGTLTAAAWGLENVQFATGSADEVLAEAGNFGVIIVDPPRSGLARPVLQELADSRAPTILYVSCLAQSLARDLVSLAEAGYRVHNLELFDFYPQTYHVELLAVLRKF